MQIIETQTRVSTDAIKQGKAQYSWSDVLRQLPMKEIRLLFYSTLFEYPSDIADPVWPLTLHQVSRYINPARTVEILEAIVAGHQKNSPTREELGEASAPLPEKQPEPARPVLVPAAPGGAVSNELLAAALG